MGSAALSKIQEFIKFEGAGGIVLMATSILALIIANSTLAGVYDAFLATPVAIEVGALKIAKPLLLWVNDGLMAVFFLLVGLEIKREFLQGELSSRDQALLPFLAAVGGMAVPAAFYAALNWGDPVAIRGWAIPAATDIAFALGILALVGSRAPLSLKVFLMAIAIIDDLGAILIIATFYTENLSVGSLSLAAIGLTALALLNVAGVRRLAPYLLVGVFLWVCVLKSGVHATLAGVAIAMAIPLKPGREGQAEDQEGQEAPLLSLEHALLPWVAFAIMPLFGFANAGVSFAGIGFGSFAQPVTAGIIAGLVFGKMAGVFGMTWLAVKSGLAKMPAGTTWMQIYGVACLCGVGFTMSLFIGTLAFEDPSYAATVRLGVLSGSLVAALIGYACLRWATSDVSDKAPQPAPVAAK